MILPVCVCVTCRGRLITGWRRGSAGRMLRPCCRRRGRLRPNCCGPTSPTNCSWPKRRSLRYNAVKIPCVTEFDVFVFSKFRTVCKYWMSHLCLYIVPIIRNGKHDETSGIKFDFNHLFFLFTWSFSGHRKQIY